MKKGCGKTFHVITLVCGEIVDDDKIYCDDCTKKNMKDYPNRKQDAVEGKNGK